MTLTDLAALASILSSIAVAASLVYLGLQTHQNVKHTRALIEQGRVNRLISQYLSMADERLATAHIVGNGGVATPDEVLRRLFWLECQVQFFSWQDAFFQREQGLLSEETFARSRAFFLRRLKDEPGLRASFVESSARGEGNFIKFVKGLLAESEVHPASN